MNGHTMQMIASGQWWDGDLDEALDNATEDWDLAAKGDGPWSVEVDVGDYAKILRELKDRREAEGDA